MSQKVKNKGNTHAAMYAVILTVALICAAAVVFSAISAKNRDNPDSSENNMLRQISEYSGYTRIVSQEEFDFYRTVVERGISDETDEEQIKSLTRDYITKVNGAFYLGNKLGLCEPYSFSSLQYDMEQENNNRKIKIENGEVVYGVEAFTLSTYFDYAYSQLETDLLTFLTENAPEEIISDARAYYEKHKESYKNLSSVTYSVTENGNSQEHTINSEEYSILRNSDEMLADFIAQAQEGEVLCYEYSGAEREVKLIKIEYSIPEFEQSAYSVIQSYISGNVLQELIETVAQNNKPDFSKCK